jgi:hypothetical protein
MDTITLTVIHLGLLAAWSGSMGYSLVIVQPRLATALAHDDDLLEDLTITLGAGNRRPVLAIIGGLFVSLGCIVVVGDLSGSALVLAVAEAVLLLAATALFATVSWKLWPRRVFALPSERPRHRATLRRTALTMTGLIGASFVLAAVTAQL